MGKIRAAKAGPEATGMADTQLYWRGALEKGIPEHHSGKLAGQEEERLHLSES